MFLKSSTGGVWNSNRAAQIWAVLCNILTPCVIQERPLSWECTLKALHFVFEIRGTQTTWQSKKYQGQLVVKNALAVDNVGHQDQTQKEQAMVSAAGIALEGDMGS